MTQYAWSAMRVYAAESVARSSAIAGEQQRDAMVGRCVGSVAVDTLRAGGWGGYNGRWQCRTAAQISRGHGRGFIRAQRYPARAVPLFEDRTHITRRQRSKH